jgi:hypothetical protein
MGRTAAAAGGAGGAHEGVTTAGGGQGRGRTAVGGDGEDDSGRGQCWWSARGRDNGRRRLKPGEDDGRGRWGGRRPAFL